MKSQSFIMIPAVLVMLCLCCACVSPFGPAETTLQATPLPSNATPIIDVGIKPLERQTDNTTISFAEARSELRGSQGYSFDILQKKPVILFMQGSGIDGQGNAVRWLFGINWGDAYELRVYDRSGWTIIPWYQPIIADTIDLDRVIPPDLLVNESPIQNQNATVFWPGSEKDVELKNGIYTFTLTSGSASKVLMFNATTGAAIEYHD
jgi:hypothetical protein